MQQNIVNENKYTGFGTKKTFSSITKINKDSASERNPALEKALKSLGISERHSEKCLFLS